MATTTNFGWETPDDTDLVKDGAAAMRTLGNSIDTSFVDLKGGTTGQILAKASNTDLDYTWITNDVGDITAVTAGTGISGGGTTGAVTITNSMATIIDAKGDLVVGTGADTFDRLAVGTNGQALLADSTTATGLKWGSSTPSYTKTDFTPVVGQSNAVTIASSTCWYIAIDKLVFVQFAINIGGSGTSNNYITLSLPNGTNTFAGNEIIGQVRIYRASTATNYYGFVMGDGANVAFVSGLNKTNSTSTFWGGSSSDYAFALANNDAIQGSFWYRKA